MGKFGLYAVDATEELELSGYPKTGVKWQRTALIYNGKTINKTATESNKFGLYAKNNHLKLNGKDVATASNDTAELVCDSNNASFGDAILQGTKCINITKENYKKLRSGYEVAGYTRYSPFAVYNIVNDVETAETVEFDEYSDLDDRLYNNFVNDFPDNELTDQTYLDPVHTPSLAVRAFDVVLKKGQGIEFEYFVDTTNYDSVYKGEINDTFTLIVEDFYGNVLYKKTTYAGELICKASYPKAAFNSNEPAVGETYISVRCVDNHGRGSVQYSFPLLIKPEVAENFYDVTLDDLVRYNITPNISKFDLVKGYNNKKGLSRLIRDIKNSTDENGKSYTGIRLYNDCDSKDLEDPNNTTYIIDLHRVTRPNVVEGNNDNFIEPDSITDTNQLTHITDYYLLEYKDGNIVGLADGTGASKEDFEDFKIVQGKTFTINGVTRTVDTDPISWIRKDGAHIYRNEDDKVLVFWQYDLRDDEVIATDTSASARMLRIKNLNLAMQFLKDGVSLTNAKSPFREGNGYYYLGFLSGQNSRLFPVSSDSSGDTTGYDYLTVNYSLTPQPSGDSLRLPNNFIVDFNYATIAYSDATDIKPKSKLISLNGSIDVTIRNAKFVGPYTTEIVKTAFLNQFLINGSPWEGTSCMNLTGSKYCTLDNVVVCNGAGYETTMGPLDSNISGFSHNSRRLLYRTEEGSNRLNFNTLGYINNSGTFVEDNCVIKNNGQSLLPSNESMWDVYITPDDTEGTKFLHRVAFDFHTGATDVCLVTSNKVSVNNVYHKLYDDFYDTYIMCSGIQNGVVVQGYTASTGQSYHGGKRLEFFIHCYDENDNYIKTIKTRQHLRACFPPNTASIKLTGYGMCNVDGNDVSLLLLTQDIFDETLAYLREEYTQAAINKINFTSDYIGLERSLFDIQVTPGIYTYGAKFINYCVHDSNTMALCGPSWNTQFKDCHFYRIGCTPRRFNTTAVFMDIEENFVKCNGMSFINCRVDYTPAPNPYSDNTQTQIVGAPINVYMKDCVGLSIGGVLTDCYIKDCTCGLFNPSIAESQQPHARGVYKRLKVVYKSYFGHRSDKDPLVPLVNQGAVFKIRNTTCDQQMEDIICLEDCFYKDAGGGHGTRIQVMGRANKYVYNTGITTTDNYIPIEEQLND